MAILFEKKFKIIFCRIKMGGGREVREMIAELWLFVPDVDLVSCGPLGDLGLLMLDPVWGQGVHRWTTETGASALSTKICCRL